MSDLFPETVVHTKTLCVEHGDRLAWDGGVGCDTCMDCCDRRNEGLGGFAPVQHIRAIYTLSVVEDADA